MERLKRFVACLVFLLLAAGTLRAQAPHSYGVADIKASGATSWVSGITPSGAFVTGWTWSLVPGATAPDTCAAVIEVCNELDDAQCTGSNVIETGAAAADCTTAQAVICADQTCAFRWVRANFGTFTGSGATLKSILLGWQQ